MTNFIGGPSLASNPEDAFAFLAATKQEGVAPSVAPMLQRYAESLQPVVAETTQVEPQPTPQQHLVAQNVGTLPGLL
jgi:hypothetical protein